MNDVSRELLTENGLKATPFRLLLLDILRKSSSPMSAAQLMSKMQTDFDRVTLFRNLKLLEGRGILSAADFGQGGSYYCLNLSQRHHHHILCVKCEKVEPIDFCGISPMIEKANRRGFKVLTHHLELTGICSKCA